MEKHRRDIETAITAMRALLNDLAVEPREALALLCEVQEELSGIITVFEQSAKK